MEKRIEIKWIPCDSEVLPDHYETVMLCVESRAQIGLRERYISVGTYDYIAMRWTDFCNPGREVWQGDAVTHWAHLPELPEGMFDR